MDIDQAYRDRLATQLSSRLAQALKTGEIPTADVSASAQYILDNIASVTTYEQLIVFLTTLSSKWPIFVDFLSREKTRVKSNDAQELAKVEASLDEVRKGVQNVG